MQRNKEELYLTMTRAIEYMRAHAHEHPSPASVALEVGMSPGYFTHMFAQWVGTSPKSFLSHLAKEHAKAHLRNSKDILRAAYASGLSGPGRLHDLLVTYEAVSPGELKNGEVAITYGIHSTPFGRCLIAVTARGICQLSFLDGSDAKAIIELKRAWPKARITHSQPVTAPYIQKIFSKNKTNKPLHLLLKGTNFQIKVWEALIKIPEGKVLNYGALARAIRSPRAARAVGSACGKNSIAYLIPCHRVLAANGTIGHYRWGSERKEAILAWESVRN